MTNTIITEIKKECSRIEEDSTYSGKGHYNSYVYWRVIHYLLGIPAIVSAILSSINFLYCSYIFAILATIFSALQTFIEAGDKAEKHKNAGGCYFSLKNRVRIFYKTELDLLTEKEASLYLKGFAEERDRFNDLSPSIPYIAFWFARKGIEEGENKYKVDSKKSK